MKQKKIPLRCCVGCGEMKPKQELVRVVRAADETISLDLIGKKSGRGAYLCKNAECLKKAKKSKKLQRAFSCEVPDEIYDHLNAELTADE
ncbi:MAG: YlxR family protein [Clostridia bacterium]|nr:YlxR family protein [Clostridia bacterium]